MKKLKKLIDEGINVQERMKDPVFFINEVIHKDDSRFNLTPYQEEWLQFLMSKKRINVMAFRSSGKSQLFFIDYPIYKAFSTAGWQGILISNSLNQSVSLLRRVRESILQNDLLRTSIPSGKDMVWSKTQIQLKNGSIIWSRPNSENLAGEHVDYIGGDEIGYWKEMDIITKVIPPMLLAKNGNIAFVGTPTSELDAIHELQKNQAYYSAEYPADKRWRTGKTLWQLRYPKTPMANIKAQYDSLSWSREFLCKPLSTKDKIYPFELIQQSFDYDSPFTQSTDEKSNYYIGMDFALSGEAGSDFTVFSVLQKLKEKVRLINMERYRGMSYQSQKARIFFLNQIYKPTRVLVDEGTFGKAFLQDLLTEHVPAMGFRFTNESKQNLHTNMREMFEKGQIIINYGQDDTITKTTINLLVREMDKFGIVFEKGVVKLMGLGEHDDMVTSLALACWSARGMSKIAWTVMRGGSNKPTGITFMQRIN